jgi:hypothetical protein
MAGLLRLLQRGYAIKLAESCINKSTTNNLQYVLITYSGTANNKHRNSWDQGGVPPGHIVWKG